MIREWLQEYNPSNKEDLENALREIMQEIALAGLHRAGFFERAAFYGGTALRIFHNLDRFSEDLDFSLLEKNPDFKLTPYLESILEEFRGAGLEISIRSKTKSVETNIESAFLKSETLLRELVLKEVMPQEHLNIRSGIMIKFEVDIMPPGGFETEDKLLIKPNSFYVRCFTLPDLFAGKMHALIFRKWKKRVKGRDWYDFEWYIKRKIPLNLSHFLIRAQDSGHWDKATISQEEFLEMLKTKINTVSFEEIRNDIVRFIKNDESLKIWSSRYFIDLSENLIFV